MHKSNMHAALTIAAIISALKTAPSYAFTLTDTSNTFENAWLANDIPVARVATSDAAAPLIPLGNYTSEPEPVLNPDGLISPDAMDTGVHEAYHRQQ